MLIRHALIDYDGEVYVHVDEVPQFKYMCFKDKQPYFWAEREGFVAHFYCDRVMGASDMEIPIMTDGGVVRLKNPYPSRPSIFNRQCFPHSIACTFVEWNGSHVKGAVLMSHLQNVELKCKEEAKHHIEFRAYQTSTDLIYVPCITKMMVPSFRAPYGNPRLSHWDKFGDQGEEAEWERLVESRDIITSEKLQSY